MNQRETAGIAISRVSWLRVQTPAREHGSAGEGEVGRALEARKQARRLPLAVAEQPAQHVDLRGHVAAVYQASVRPAMPAREMRTVADMITSRLL